MELHEMEKKITQYQKELSEAVKDKAKLEGAIEASVQRLKAEFNFTDVHEAEKKILTLMAEKNQLTAEIEKAITDIQAKYGI